MVQSQICICMQFLRTIYELMDKTLKLCSKPTNQRSSPLIRVKSRNAVVNWPKLEESLRCLKRIRMIPLIWKKMHPNHPLLSQHESTSFHFKECCDLKFERACKPGALDTAPSSEDPGSRFGPRSIKIPLHRNFKTTHIVFCCSVLFLKKELLNHRIFHNRRKLTHH